jgi:hypothetical protein
MTWQYFNHIRKDKAMPKLIQDQPQFFLRAETDITGNSVRIDVVDNEGGWIQNLIAIYPHTIFIKKWETAEAAAKTGMLTVPSIWFDNKELSIQEPTPVPAIGIELQEAA